MYKYDFRTLRHTLQGCRGTVTQTRSPAGGTGDRGAEAPATGDPPPKGMFEQDAFAN